MVATRQTRRHQDWPDDSMGVIRAEKPGSRPEVVSGKIIRSENLGPAPAPVVPIGRIPRAAREDRSAAEIETTILKRREVPGCAPAPIREMSATEGRKAYMIHHVMNPGRWGFNMIEADLNTDGGGVLTRIWTTGSEKPDTDEKRQMGVPFPITYEQITCLMAAALDRRLGHHASEWFQQFLAALPGDTTEGA